MRSGMIGFLGAQPPVEPAINMIALPLTYDEDDHEAAMTWVRQGNGPHVTPMGFEADGYSSRLKSTTIPTWMQPAAAPLTLHASMSFYPQTLRTSGSERAVYLGTDAGGAKMRLSILPDATNAAITQSAVLCGTGGSSFVQITFGRSSWRYELRTPEVSLGGYDALPQMIGFLDSSTLLMSVHFEDTKSRVYKIRLSDGAVLGSFDSDTYPHMGVCAQRSNGDWWMGLGGGVFGRVDIDASFTGGTLVLLDTCTISAVAGGGAAFITVSGTEYFVIGDYALSGAPYFYVFTAASLGTVTLDAAARFKRFTGAPIECQGLSVRGGLLYTSSVAKPGTGTSDRYGFIGAFDIAAAITSTADGGALSVSSVADGPSKYCEDIAVHPVTGDIWAVTEGLSAVGSDIGFLAAWSSPVDGSIAENHYTIEYDGSSVVASKVNNRAFQSVAGTLSNAVEAVCVGGPPNVSPGVAAQYFTGYVKDIVIQDQPMTAAQYSAAVSGSYEPNSLTAYEFTLANPGAETGDVSGWTAETGAMGVVSYPHSGSHNFYGGTVASTIVRQRLDVAAQTGLSGAQIDALAAAGAIWTKARWWQSNLDSTDPCGMGVRNLNASNAAIDGSYSAMLAYPNTHTPDYWLYYPRCYSQLMASGTRSIDALMKYARDTGTASNGYFDDITVTVYAKE